jgi:hypothetical protein
LERKIKLTILLSFTEITTSLIITPNFPFHQSRGYATICEMQQLHQITTVDENEKESSFKIIEKARLTGADIVSVL